jgi:hypothetical protein
VIAAHFSGITMRKLPKNKIRNGKLFIANEKRTTNVPVAVKNLAPDMRT